MASLKNLTQRRQPDGRKRWNQWADQLRCARGFRHIRYASARVFHPSPFSPGESDLPQSQVLQVEKEEARSLCLNHVQSWCVLRSLWLHDLRAGKSENAFGRYGEKGLEAALCGRGGPPDGGRGARRARERGTGKQRGTAL